MIEPHDDEERRLHSVALQNAQSILQARQRAETELVRANAALEAKTAQLARSLSMLRATLESTTDAILVTDVSGAIGGYNTQFLELWGFSARVVDDARQDQLLERIALQLEDSGAFLARVNEIAAESTSDTFDLVELADGRLVEQVTKIQALADGPVGRVWSFREVTERKRLEEARFRLAAVVDSSDDAIISKTLDGVITTWNTGAERMFGYRPEEIVGKPVTVLIPADHIHEEAEILRRLQAGHRIEELETVRIHKDGRHLDVSLTISPVKDSGGAVIGVSKIARDITARKRADQELREESRVVNLLNETGTSIAANLDLQSLLRTVTHAATQLSGAEFGAFLHKVTEGAGAAFELATVSGAPREAFDLFGAPGAAPLFAPAFEDERPIRCGDLLRDERYAKAASHCATPPGGRPLRSYLAVPIVSRTGEVIGGLVLGHSSANVFAERIERVIVGVAAQAAVAIDNAHLYERVRRDAEERNRLLEAERSAREEAERVNLMKDEFLATLSHELRTPLNAIVGWAQVLRTQGHMNGDLSEGLAVIERNARIQAQLIDDLLDMSRIISGKIHLEVERVDVQDVVKAAIASVRHSADSKGIALQVLLDPMAGPVRGDPNRLQQCFWNLLSNAIKFTPKGGKVLVSLARVEGSLELCVVDDGQGISAEFLPHVFERFRQADASTTRHHGGLGLGLSIVKNLIELHGGSVRASSAGEGRGASFYIELPVMALEAAPVEERRERSRSYTVNLATLDHPRLDGLTILAVDDEPDALSLIKRVLEDCGARVLLAESAKDGLAVLLREKPDMLLSDIGMPDEDGYQFIQQVRRLRPDEGGRIPAAALTAFARTADRTRALRAGYQTHLPKPIEPMELTAVVFSLARRG